MPLPFGEYVALPRWERETLIEELEAMIAEMGPDASLTGAPPRRERL